MSPLVAEIIWNSGTIMMALIFGLPIVSVLGGMWFKLNKVRSDNELKRTMVERGMSADEIERVINARPRESRE